MILFRSVVFFAVFALWTAVMSVLLIAAAPFARGGRSCGMVGGAWARVTLNLLATLCRLDYRIEGWEKIPEGSAILLVKHQSAWETIALRGLLSPKQSWVLKQELLRIPFFGWALALCKPIAIDRKAGRRAVRQMLDQGTRALKAGRLVVIFPEGTRTAPGERKRYGMGGALLAEKSGFPVIPIAHNAGVFWRRRSIRKHPGVVQVVVGPVIQSAGKTAAEINQETEDWIEATVASLPGASTPTR